MDLIQVILSKILDLTHQRSDLAIWYNFKWYSCKASSISSIDSIHNLSDNLMYISFSQGRRKFNIFFR